MNDVAGILLAAGGSTRLGQPKQLLTFGGKTLIRRAAEAGLDAGLAPLVVVIGPEPAAMRQALAGLPVVIVHNENFARGQSTSLRAGLAALPPATRAVMLLLVDMPGVDAAVVRAVIGAWRRTRAPIVRPAFEGRPGNPVLFAGDALTALATAEGDAGGRAVLQARAAEICLVPVGTAGVLQDVDTWDDYQALLAAEARGAEIANPGRR